MNLNSFFCSEERFILCYSARGGRGESDQDCNPFEGNPFKPFWYHFNVTKFVRSLLHSPLATQFTEAKYWKAPYKNIKVLAFVGKTSETFAALIIVLYTKCSSF